MQINFGQYNNRILAVADLEWRRRYNYTALVFTFEKHQILLVNVTTAMIKIIIFIENIGVA